MSFHIHARLLFGTAFLGFVALTLLIAVIPAYQIQKTPPTPGLQPLTDEATRGMKLYVAEGCSYCHSQQVRPLRVDEPFGRPSAAGDYVYQTRSCWGRSAPARIYRTSAIARLAKCGTCCTCTIRAPWCELR